MRTGLWIRYHDSCPRQLCLEKIVFCIYIHLKFKKLFSRYLIDPTISADATLTQTGSAANIGMPRELAADLERGLRPPAPRSSPEAQGGLCCLCLRLAFTALRMLVGQLVKDMLAKAVLPGNRAILSPYPLRAILCWGSNYSRRPKGSETSTRRRSSPSSALW